MQITHEEARQLIQFKADNRLNSTNEEKLNSHLKACQECQHYFDAIKETESMLRLTMRKQWNAHPLPLQTDAIYAKVNSNSGANILLSTRSALIGLAFVMFAFLAWQTMTSSTSSAQVPLSTVPLIPTPSTQFTATNTLQNDCKYVRYLVQKGDTLEAIASQFSVSKESIITLNNLTSEAVVETQELAIPFCESTPTGTSRPPAYTITPYLQPISTTPG